MVLLLLQHKSSSKAPAMGGMTALHFAAQKGHKEVAEAGPTWN
ncbi:hypothetical protein ETH_00041245 [Eimeria tenella]|uniref:Uncharacterized protein n=1 Tax=Eimeria tenella TaxID=5802 RepID=U6L2R4_EIMTE|nr:hypothetical protein ETH_00041245 [Eimeria tenella]CDJ44436.1 hypothetical protein ETH_00041245 [Eimeria tenella]|eukprot:XP_013235185.1 hypothetical protein ETH_00041245 [Eimeria tenella]